MKRALYHLIQTGNHVITEIVKTKFVIGTIGNIRIIGNLSLIKIQIMNNQTYRESKELINLSHPLAVSFCQVIIDRNDMSALAFQRIQINRCYSDQRLTFTSTHFGNVATVKNHTPDKLYIILTHTENTAGSFPYNSKSLRQDIIQCFSISQTVFKFYRLMCQ